MARRTRTRDLVELTRFQRPMSTALFTVLGAFLGTPGTAIPFDRVALAAVAVGLVTAFAFVINDYCDVSVDAIGRPHRPIPSGRVPPRSASTFAGTLALLALAVSGFLGFRLTLVAAFAILLSALYSYRWKGTLLLGNATVAFLVGGVLLYGAMAAGAITPAALAAAAIAFPYILGQEALFDVEDEEQDRKAGLRTTGTALGLERGSRLVRWIFFSFVIAALTLGPWILGRASLAYLAALTVLVLAPTLVVLRHIRPPVSRESVARAARWSRLVWMTSFIPLAMLR